MSACLAEDPMLENLERKLEITYCLNRSKLRKERFQEAGA